jgi:hypothetical protein
MPEKERVERKLIASFFHDSFADVRTRFEKKEDLEDHLNTIPEDNYVKLLPIWAGAYAGKFEINQKIKKRIKELLGI